VIVQSRITFFVGHFGSGKTEIVLNEAVRLAADGVAVTVADLDVVKPYFRSRSARQLLDEAGVRLLVPTGENVFADLPIIVPQIRSALREPGRRVILDVGGDDTGARVIGSFADAIPRDETECLLVLNFRRPSTPDPDRAVAMVRAIEQVGRLPVTGLVSNTHLLDETSVEVVMEGVRMAEETARLVGVPIRAVTVARGLAAELPAGLSFPVVEMERIVRPPHEQPLRTRTQGPLFVLT